MKNYRLLLAIGLLAIWGLGLYMLIDTNSSDRAIYDGYLMQAREMREQDIQVDAMDYYNKALQTRPSLELNLEIADYYLEMGQKKMAMNKVEAVLNEYPTESAAYEYAMKLYHENKDYVACYKLYDTFIKRGLTSVVIDSHIQEMEYDYYFTGEYSEVSVFSGGYCAVRLEDKWGYVNQTGGRVISIRFPEAGAFVGELAPVMDAEGYRYYIDTKGNKKRVVTTVEPLEGLTLLTGEMFGALSNGSWHLCSLGGGIIAGDYEACSAISGGFALVRQNGMWGAVDVTGNEKFPFKYADVALDEKAVAYRNDRLFLKENTGYQMYDGAGVVIGTEIFDDAKVFYDGTYAAVMQGNKWGFIDKEGAWKITPQYEDARSFSNGYAAVCVNGKWGFINEANEMVIEPQFEDAMDFNGNGCVFVKRNEKWSLLRLYKHNH